MAHIAGVKVLKNSHGKPTKLVIDIHKHFNFIEDFLDMLDIEIRKTSEKFSFDKVVKSLDKKHGIKRK